VQDACSLSNNSIFRASILGLILIVLTVGFSALAVSAETLSSCSKINSSGTYNLDSSINIRENETCMNITSSDVILDGNDNYINGTNTSGENGLVRISNESKRLENITVRGLTLFNSDFDNNGSGIVALDASGIRIENMNLSSHDGGILLGLSNVNNSIIRNSVIQSINSIGIITAGQNNNFTNLSIKASSGIKSTFGEQKINNSNIKTNKSGLTTIFGKLRLNSVNITSNGSPELVADVGNSRASNPSTAIKGSNVNLNRM
jgi:hypothetical protein